jgi:hypothetical protein
MISKNQNDAIIITQEIRNDIHKLDMLIDDGWTSVDYPYGFESRHHAIDIEHLVEENLGTFKRSGRTFIFEDAKDASMFLLKWT